MEIELKAKCIKIEATENGSSATFVVLNDKQPENGPGQRRVVSAKQVTQMNFQDDAAKGFTVGQPATIIVRQDAKRESEKENDKSEPQ